MSNTATVVLSRAKAPGRDRTRAYKIVMDDRVVGEVRDGQDFTCELEPGSHTLRIKIDWTGSVTLPFTVAQGDTAAFECEPASGSAFALGDLLLRRPWVSLRQVHER